MTIDAESGTAPFEQVRTQIASAVAAGQLSAGTKLPTVRQLSADLGLAANTVARAYRELEADAVIATHGRGAHSSAAMSWTSPSRTPARLTSQGSCLPSTFTRSDGSASTPRKPRAWSRTPGTRRSR
jgi:DNA-binding transcriptional MocR family regulator